MLALPEIFLSAVALVLVLVAAFGGETAANARRVTQLAMGGIAIALIIVIGAFGENASAFGGMYAADSFSGYMKILVMAGTLAALAMSLRTEGESDMNKPEYSLLVLLALVGMMLKISADNLMSLYMAIELQSLPLYVVAAMRTNSLRSSEAGLKLSLIHI